jgi:hypothetical protein
VKAEEAKEEIGSDSSPATSEDDEDDDKSVKAAAGGGAKKVGGRLIQIQPVHVRCIKTIKIIEK